MNRHLYRSIIRHETMIRESNQQGRGLGHFNNLNCTCISCEGAVKVWDPRQKDEPVVNMQPAEGEAKRDCWTVAFGKLF